MEDKFDIRFRKQGNQIVDLAITTNGWQWNIQTLNQKQLQRLRNEISYFLADNLEYSEEGIEDGHYNTNI